MPKTPPNPNYRILTVKDLRNFLTMFQAQGQITDDTEIWLSSDEEGNDFGPLVQCSRNGEVQMGCEPDKSKLTLYPISI